MSRLDTFLKLLSQQKNLWVPVSLTFKCLIPQITTNVFLAGVSEEKLQEASSLMVDEFLAQTRNCLISILSILK